ncbi:MAG: type II toxin-antitoxin system prevent-host-death family antitoxin [Candidatus Peregrinibacteria bacterium]
MITTVPSKDLKNKIGGVLSLATRAPVAITRNGQFSFVILSSHDWKTWGGDRFFTQKITPGNTQKSWKNTPLFGIWKDREDLPPAEEYVEEMRKSRF